MRRLIFLTALVTLAAITPGCRVKKQEQAKTVVPEAQPVGVVNMADASAAAQLTRGFWAIENQSWRWTMKNFNLILRTPAGAAQKGATLQMKFVLPEVIFNRLGAMTVDAHVGGVDLGPQKYAQAGEASYERDVPASALSSDLVTIDFSVDKALPPSEKDTRELALVVSTIGLVPK